MAIGELTAQPSGDSQRRVAMAVLGGGLAVVLVGVLAALGAPLQLAAMSGVAVLGLMLLTRPRAATLLFIGILYANVPIVASSFHGVPSVIAVGAPLLLLGVALMSYLVIRRGEPVLTPTLGWLIAYLGVQVLSAALSLDAEAAASTVASFATEGLLLYVLLTNAVRDMGTFRGAVIVLLLVGTILGGLSVFQEVTGTYRNEYWGFAQTREIDPLVVLPEDATLRLAGPVGEKNRYAQIMLVLLPLALFAYITSKTALARTLAGVAGTAILAGMLLTFSRGAGVALAILVLIAIGLRYIRLRDAIVVATALVVSVYLFAPQYVARIESLVGVGALVSGDTDEADGAIRGRATSNLASLSVFLDHPVLGVGPGQYVAIYSQDVGNQLGIRYRETTRRAHNMALEVAADTGLAGIVTLGGVFGATLAGLWRVRRTWRSRRPEYSAWATAFMLSVVGYLLTSLFLHIAYMRYLWLLIALANSLIWILDREAARESDEQPAVDPVAAGSIAAVSPQR